jgi:hypothetical protein
MMDKAETNGIPVTFKAGYQISPLFSLNAFGGHSSATSSPTIVNDGLALTTTTKQTFVGLRGELKKGLGERFEVYGGAALGYVHQNIEEKTSTGDVFVRNPDAPSPNNPNASAGRMLYAGFVGTNFYLLKNLGIYSEIGAGVTLLNFGLTARF